MIRNIKLILVLAILGIILITIIYNYVSFRKNTNYYFILISPNENREAYIYYKNTIIDIIGKSFKAEYPSRLTVATRTLYLEKLMEDEYIEINFSGKAIYKIYAYDNMSVMLVYETYKGIKRVYKLSNYGDFNKHLEPLYTPTSNPIFIPLIKD